MYRRQIEVEERDIFPLAAQVLPSDAVAWIGREMAVRRGLDAPGSAGSAAKTG